MGAQLLGLVVHLVIAVDELEHEGVEVVEPVGDGLQLVEFGQVADIEVIEALLEHPLKSFLLALQSQEQLVFGLLLLDRLAHRVQVGQMVVHLRM
jgi:hypothetical protein